MKQNTALRASSEADSLKSLLGNLPAGLPVLVTGATGSIGSQIAAILAQLGVPMILGVRNPQKYEVVKEEIAKKYPNVVVEHLHLDLNSSKEVTEAVNTLHGRKLAGIINNAGIMMRDFTLSPDGPETTLNVNFYNTRLLNLLLLENVERGGAIVFTTSITRKAGHFGNLPTSVTPETFGQLKTYALSKKLITRFAADFTAQAEQSGVRVNCTDPGVVDTNMITMHRWYDPLANVLFRPFIRRPVTGAFPAVKALLIPQTGQVVTLKSVEPLRGKR
jgi:NAD(P)-dependent dehydrogenase (short-subunit alcohol dehydrogenase family)